MDFEQEPDQEKRGEYDPLIVHLWHDNFNELQSLVRRKVHDRHAAEELIQEAFLESVRAADKLSTHPNPKAWLKKTLINKCKDYARKLGRPKKARKRPRRRGLEYVFWHFVVEDLLLYGVKPPKYLARTLEVLQKKNWNREQAEAYLCISNRQFQKLLDRIRKWANKEYDTYWECRDALFPFVSHMPALVCSVIYDRGVALLSPTTRKTFANNLRRCAANLPEKPNDRRAFARILKQIPELLFKDFIENSDDEHKVQVLFRVMELIDKESATLVKNPR